MTGNGDGPIVPLLKYTLVLLSGNCMRNTFQKLSSSAAALEKSSGGIGFPSLFFSAKIGNGKRLSAPSCAAFLRKFLLSVVMVYVFMSLLSVPGIFLSRVTNGCKLLIIQ